MTGLIAEVLLIQFSDFKLYNRWNIAENVEEWPLHISVIDNLGFCLGIPEWWPKANMTNTLCVVIECLCVILEYICKNCTGQILVGF